ALADWQAGRGVSTRVRVVALLMVWSGIALAVVARDMPPWLACALVVMAAVVSTVILQLPAAGSARHPGGPGPHVPQARRIRGPRPRRRPASRRTRGWPHRKEEPADDPIHDHPRRAVRPGDGAGGDRMPPGRRADAVHADRHRHRR